MRILGEGTDWLTETTDDPRDYIALITPTAAFEGTGRERGFGGNEKLAEGPALVITVDVSRSLGSTSIKGYVIREERLELLQEHRRLATMI